MDIPTKFLLSHKSVIDALLLDFLKPEKFHYYRSRTKLKVNATSMLINVARCVY
ncbi:hypothetical protein PrebiDRAFT_0653 [Prevotella bivia DSM 20514]|uniref:Uncharacterized protein n=1 Tax=Prevotella bivia DSM 20514 TaxID=868129 RepID=I4Z855_9BACT|nr:hypothetical protein PrebiDRAFT_0653 [Prevotella bivia DSM 20514]